MKKAPDHRSAATKSTRSMWKSALALIFKVVENFSAKLRMTTSYANSHQITIEKDVTRYIEPECFQSSYWAEA